MSRLVVTSVVALAVVAGRLEARQPGAGAPVAGNDTYATAFRTSITVPPPGVLANDIANGPGTLTARLLAGGPGTLDLRADGGFTFTPDPFFVGAYTFLYTLYRDTRSGSTGLVTIDVAGPVGVPPPVANGDQYDVGANSTLVVEAPAFLANDDTRGEYFEGFDVLTSPLHGVLQFPGNGFTYTPGTGFSGVDSFTYRLRSLVGPSAPATVTITVAPPGTPIPPSDFRVVGRQGNTVTFGWTPPGSGPTPTGFRLEGGTAPGTIAAVVPLGPTVRATVTLPAGAFYVRLRSLAGAAASKASAELALLIDQPVPPAPPTNVLGGVTGNRVELAWLRGLSAGVASNVVLDVTGSYTGSLPIGDVESLVIDGVPDGTYTIAVRQVGPGGSSAPSPPVTVTVPTACPQTDVPGLPRRVQAFMQGSLVVVEWDPPVAGPAPTGYELQVSSPFVATVPVQGRAIAAALARGSYTFTLAATTRCGTGGSVVHTVVVP